MEVEIEVEALHHCYDDKILQVIKHGKILEITFSLVPRHIESYADAYVTAKLKLKIENIEDYPEISPHISIIDVNGMPDNNVATLLQRIREEAKSMQGELVLGLLCELALDTITEMNHPSGDCAFCLENINRSDSSSTSLSRDILKLDCFHCFHLHCFSSWYRWQQKERAHQHQQLLDDYRSIDMASEYLIKHGIYSETHRIPSTPPIATCKDDDTIHTDTNKTAKDVVVYSIYCPWCRYRADPSSLKHILPFLLGIESQDGDDNDDTSTGWMSRHGQHNEDLLSLEERQHVKKLQEKFAAVLEAQRQCHGLIQSVAVSLEELHIATQSMRTMNKNEDRSETCNHGDGSKTKKGRRRHK